VAQGSETTKVGTDEQEPDTEAIKVGLGSTSYQRPKVLIIYMVDPAGIDGK
jgi:hypothetical protein